MLLRNWQTCTSEGLPIFGVAMETCSAALCCGGFVLLPSHLSVVIHREPTFSSTHSSHHKPSLPYYFNQRDFDIISSHLALRTCSVLLILTEINLLFSCWILPAASVVIRIVSRE